MLLLVLFCTTTTKYCLVANVVFEWSVEMILGMGAGFFVDGSLFINKLVRGDHQPQLEFNQSSIP